MSNDQDRITFLPILRLILLMWVFFFVQDATEYDLGFLGILPRDVNGLIGVFTAPLVHGNYRHIISNTIPILTLGGALFFFYPKIALRILLQCYFFTNFFVWLFGRSFYHIGASGLVYGLAFFLIFLGIFRRDFKTLLISVIVITIYGGLVYNALVLDDRVSWESHLFGSIVGVVSAYTSNRFLSRSI